MTEKMVKPRPGTMKTGRAPQAERLSYTLEELQKELEQKVRERTSALMSEIAERKRAEQALRESEERYRALIDLSAAAGEAIVMLQDTPQAEGMQVFANEAWQRLTGYAAQELIGWSFFNLVHPEHRQASLERHRTKMSGQAVPGLFEAVIIRKDGVGVPVELTGAHTTYQGRRANVVYIRDVSARKRAEEQLRESEERFHKAFHSNPTPAVITNMFEATIIEANESYARTFGFSRSELIGGTPLKLNILRDASQRDDVVREVSRRGSYRDYEITLWTKDGEPRQMVASTEGLSLSGQPCLLSVFFDITERKKSEQDLRQLNEELQMFAYTAAHDLKAPLVTIQGFASRLHTDLEKNRPERITEDVALIEAGVSRMQRLLKGILDYGRINRRVQPDESVPFREIIEEAIQQTAGQIDASRASIVIADNFPTLTVDRVAMVHALSNLVQNSTEYLAGTRPLTIEIGHRFSNGETVFFVRDNGVGINAEQHEKVFEPFYRGARESQGSGLGLAIVRRIIEGHGGRVWIEGAAGKGATMCFTLGKAGGYAES